LCFYESCSIVQSVFLSTLALFILTFSGTFYERHDLFIRMVTLDNCSHEFILPKFITKFYSFCKSFLFGFIF
jgi:hypothetical protein